MKIKINLKRILLTILFLLVVFYHTLTMLYYICNNELNFLVVRYIVGTIAMNIAIVVIILYQFGKNIKLKTSISLKIIMLLWIFIPLVSAKINSQYVDKANIAQTILWVLVFLAFYYATLQCRKFPIDKRWILIAYGVIIGLSLPLIKIHLSGHGDRGSVIFSVYLCLTILPLVLCCIKHKKRYYPIIISLLMISATTKRTGILAAVIGCVIFYLTDGNVKIPIKKRLEKIAKITMVGTVLIALLVVALEGMGIDVVSRFTELSSDGGSGRNYIWEKVFNGFQSSDITRHFLGHGINSVFLSLKIYSDVSIKAHNDFLEVLYDYGYVGVIMLAGIIIILLKEWVTQFKQHTQQLAIYSYSMILMLFFASFSYFFIESSIINFMSVYWGIIFAERTIINDRLKRRKHINRKRCVDETTTYKCNSSDI